MHWRRTRSIEGDGKPGRARSCKKSSSCGAGEEEMTEPHHRQHLNEEQYEAVTTIKGPLLILAGADLEKHAC